MRILALEPYYSGSHQAFLDGWVEHSRHDWTLLTLPGYKWKWRMRHSAITFADEVNGRVRDGELWDVIFCSDMLNLAEFLGLVDKRIQVLPSVIYFHENQLTYPAQHQQERDMHFAMTNVVSCLAGKEVWFNSAYHRNSFLSFLPDFLKRMPDYQPVEAIETIRKKSSEHPPGVASFPQRGTRKSGPLRILWAARWEYDKDPDSFFEALKQLKNSGVDFRLSVIGPQFHDVPPVFEWAKDYFHDNIDHWGFQESREQYRSALMTADVIVSTAIHEFFGISVVEAIAAGAYPVLPRRLAYPELLGSDGTDEFFNDGSTTELTNHLKSLCKQLSEHNTLWMIDQNQAAKLVSRFEWSEVCRQLDSSIELVRSPE